MLAQISLLAVVSATMAQLKKDAGAVAMAKKRAASLSPERRKEIAQKAAVKRWDMKRAADAAAKKAAAKKGAK